MSETSLWSAVIELAIQDAIYPSSNGAAQKYRDQQDALAWLNPANSDFQKVCHLANLDPDAVYEGFRRQAVEIVLLAPQPGRRAQTNRSNSHAKTYTALGETLTLGEWSKRIGIPHANLYSRLNNGWPVEAALMTPVTSGKRAQRPHVTKEPAIA